MMRIATTTAALLALTAGGAIAQTLVPATPMGTSAVADGLVRASDIEDSDIYTLSRDGSMLWDDNTIYDAVDPNWEDIGEIEDVVLNSEGQMVGVIAEVGGWLGIGDKEVMLPLSDLKAIRDGGRVVYVTQMSEEQLEQFPSVDDDYWEID